MMNEDIDPRTAAFAEGFDDAYNSEYGDNLNPFDEVTQDTLWLAYEDGFKEGVNRMIEETVNY
mgnify:FL=1